jgi:hypothetical protein
MTITDTHKAWEIPTGKRVVMDYNPGWQPVGFSANKFRRQTGKLIRSGNYVHLRDDWAHVPPRTKEDIWETLMVSGLLRTVKLFLKFFIIIIFIYQLPTCVGGLLHSAKL